MLQALGVGTSSSDSLEGLGLLQLLLPDIPAQVASPLGWMPVSPSIPTLGTWGGKPAHCGGGIMKASAHCGGGIMKASAHNRHFLLPGSGCGKVPDGCVSG